MSLKRGTYFGYLKNDGSSKSKIPRQTIWNRNKMVRSIKIISFSLLVQFESVKLIFAFLHFYSFVVIRLK